VGFVVYKVALGQVFSEYFDDANLHSNNCSTITIIYHLGLVYNKPVMVAVPSRFSLTQLRIKKNTFRLSG
jgi:hypothetical protein